MSWSAADKETVKARWQNGDSARDIAADYPGATRNAVMGLVHRNGWQTPNKPKAVKSTKSKAKPMRPQSYKINGYRPPIEVAPDVFPDGEKFDAAIPQDQRKSLHDLNTRDCRWIVGDPKENDYFFCGAVSVENNPYCAHHMRRAYVSR